MASVWKRLQRVNKRAAKFQYTASYHRIDLETTPKWKPNKLSIVWTRRSRRVVTEPQDWEPSLKDPLNGSVIYPLPENHTVAVTLFKDSRTNELEDKDWTFVLEDVSPTGKRRRLASCALNMRKYASLSPAQFPLTLPLAPLSRKVARAAIRLTLHSVLLREGQATDEDMQSLASLLSVNNNSDIAVLEDLDEDDYTLSDHSTQQMHDLRQQMEEMTQSLTNSDIAATPNSVQSLNFDSRTPTAPITPQTPIDLPLTPNEPQNPFTEPKTPVNEEPACSSTPVDKLEQKFSFKPKTVAKRNLKPLELKLNLNNMNFNDDFDDKTPTADEKLMINDRDKTPVQDLLEWCQSVCSEYKQCRVLDLASSFRSGLPLCAVIHYYRPDLLDFSGLQPDMAEQNVRRALEASASLGIPQVLSVNDVVRTPSDKLAIMTYLFQLRAYFTGNELHVEQLGNSESECSYLVGRHDTDGSLPEELFSREISTRRSKVLQRPGPQAPRPHSSPLPADEAPTVASPPRTSSVSHKRSLLDKMLSPNSTKPTAKWFNDPLIQDEESPPARPEVLMTRKELTDPFGSDDEEDPPNHTEKPEQTPELELCITETKPEEVKSAIEVKQIKPPTPELPKPTPQLLSRHDELKERARQLLEATKREAREKDRDKRQSSNEKEDESKDPVVNGVNGDSPKKSMTEEERQTMLRERARKLIADARAGIVSPGSPARARGAVEIISKQSVMEEFAAAGGGDLEEVLSRSDSDHSSSRDSSLGPPDRSEDAVSVGGRSLRSFTALVERLTPDKEHADEAPETGSYIQSELEALEREQRSIDSRAASLEVRLRSVMQDLHNTQEEDKLMAQWFSLVNKKNALLRRQMQLNILEQEEDLSRRCSLLARELRLSLGVEEWRKSSDQKRRERLLLQELLSAVNKRDTLVQQMDEQEKRIEDDDEIQRNLSQVEIQRKNNCILQ